MAESSARVRRIFTVDVEMTQEEAYRFFEALAALTIDWEPEGVQADVRIGLPADALAPPVEYLSIYGRGYTADGWSATNLPYIWEDTDG